MRRTHGMSGTITYRSWKHMVARCLDPNDVGYPRYGGAGVTVHASWMGPNGFASFLAHAGERPSRAHTIDRIRNESGYEPGNVRWATPAEQARNRALTIFVTINGVSKCAKDWCVEHSVDPDTAYARIKKGWDKVDAVTTPALRHRGPKGSRHGMATIDESTARLVLESWLSSDRARGVKAQIAQRMGLTRRVVEAITKGTSWKHVYAEVTGHAA